MVKWNRKKTVTLLWDGEKWRDNETGVLVTGFAPPPPNLEKAEFVYDEPQFVEAGRFKTLLPTHEEVQQMIDDAFKRRVIPDYPAYFFEGNWIVTYDWLMHIVNRELSSIDRKIQELRDRPWWKKL